MSYKLVFIARKQLVKVNKQGKKDLKCQDQFHVFLSCYIAKNLTSA